MSLSDWILGVLGRKYFSSMCLKFPGIKNILLFYIFYEDVLCVQRLLVHRFAFLLSPPRAAVLYLADLEEHVLAHLFGSHADMHMPRVFSCRFQGPPAFCLIRSGAHMAFPHLLCSLRAIKVFFLLGLMGISQRETIIAPDKSIDLQHRLSQYLGFRDTFLKLGDQFQGFRMSRYGWTFLSICCYCC